MSVKGLNFFQMLPFSMLYVRACSYLRTRIPTNSIYPVYTPRVFSISPSFEKSTQKINHNNRRLSEQRKEQHRSFCLSTRLLPLGYSDIRWRNKVQGYLCWMWKSLNQLLKTRMSRAESMIKMVGLYAAFSVHRSLCQLFSLTTFALYVSL
jgi:hypothetical protein